jgi:hypothetical protein
MFICHVSVFPGLFKFSCLLTCFHPSIHFRWITSTEATNANACYLLTGSVSVGVWQMACRRVIVVGEKVVKDFAGMSSLFWRRPLLL